MKRKRNGQEQASGSPSESPVAGRKMSEMVLEFAGSFINAANSLEEKHARLTAACTAWNLACCEPDRRASLLQDYLSSYRKRYPATTDEDIDSIHKDMDSLISEKLRLFPNVKKQIVHAQITPTPEGDRIEVASIRME